MSVFNLPFPEISICSFYCGSSTLQKEKKKQQTKDKKNYPLSPCSRGMVCFMEAEQGWEVVLMTLITKHMLGSLFVMGADTGLKLAMLARGNGQCKILMARHFLESDFKCCHYKVKTAFKKGITTRVRISNWVHICLEHPRKGCQ